MAVPTAWYSYEDAIQLADNEVFLSATFLNRAARHMAIRPMSRRQRAEWINSHLFALDDEFDVFGGDGLWIDMHDDILSEAFGDDESFKYLSDMLRYAFRPANRRSSDFMRLRFQLLAVAFLRDDDPIVL